MFILISKQILFQFKNNSLSIVIKVVTVVLKFLILEAPVLRL